MQLGPVDLGNRSLVPTRIGVGTWVTALSFVAFARGGANPASGGGDGRSADADEGPILLFDGVCNLCSGVVRFVIPRDPEGVFRFASLQSAEAKSLLERADLPADDLETVVLVEGDDVYTKSAAAIRVGERLGGVYRVASVGRVVPRPVRDALYDFVAAHRYRWFGRKDQCMLPPEGVEDRFLEGRRD